MHSIERLTADDFERRVLSSPIPVVLAVGGDHCGPCRLLEPVLVELLPAIEGRVRVFKVDVRNASELATRLGIVALPTISFFRHGREECRWSAGWSASRTGSGCWRRCWACYRLSTVNLILTSRSTRRDYRRTPT